MRICGTESWITEETDTDMNWASSWNGDVVLIGHGASPFVVRGGNFNGTDVSGVLFFGLGFGNESSMGGFRAVLTP